MSVDKTELLGDHSSTPSGKYSSVGKSDYIQIEPGAILAKRYKVLAKLGEGGMGVVYQGLDTQLDRPVAIKLLKRNLSEDKKAIENLKQEAQVSMMLTHPGIMRLINFEHHGQYAFLLAEFVDGKDLKTIAKRRGGKLDSKTTANIVYKLCSALEYAHKNNVIHRDIKPANIMISTKKEVKLMDFGIARVFMEGDGAQPQLAGTLAYLAPELIEGAKPDTRCDIYALGMTMYELLAGEHPFKGMNAQQVVKAHLNTELPPIEGVKRELFNIVSQCIEKKPNARFQTVGELRGALGKYLGLDESYKVSRMKASMEHEKRKLEIEQEKVAEKLKMLQDEMKRIENKPAAFESAEPGFSILGYSKEGVQVRFPYLLAAITAGAGVVGAVLGEMTLTGALYDAGSDEANMAVSMAMMGATSLMIPSMFKYGFAEWFRSAAIGAVVSIACYYLWIHSANTGLVLGISYHYLMFGVALCLGAIMCEPEGANLERIMKFAPLTLFGMLASSLASMGNVANTLKFAPDKSNMFYLPLLAVAIWTTLDIREQRS